MTWFSEELAVSCRSLISARTAGLLGFGLKIQRIRPAMNRTARAKLAASQRLECPG